MPKPILKRQPKPANVLLRIRSYPETAMCDVWIIERNGPCTGSLMHGQMLSSTAEALGKALGIPLEREEMPYRV